jgi:recombinational DNA repair protein RecR
MYTPQFSTKATVTVRRLAWALKVSMPKAVDRVVNALPSIFSPGTVCLACKDQTKCKLCAFSQQPAAEDAASAV